MGGLELNGLGLYSPDVTAIVRDGPIRGEVAHAGCVQDRHLGPGVLVGPCLADLGLALDVRLEVGQYEVGVVMDQPVDQGLEEVTVAPRKVSGGDEIERPLERAIALVALVRAIATSL